MSAAASVVLHAITDGGEIVAQGIARGASALERVIDRGSLPQEPPRMRHAAETFGFAHEVHDGKLDGGLFPLGIDAEGTAGDDGTVGLDDDAFAIGEHQRRIAKIEIEDLLRRELAHLRDGADERLCGS